MENKQESKYKTRRDYVNALALENKIELGYSNGLMDSISVCKIPKSMEEASSLANFWKPIIKDFKEDIDQIDFFYQENDKELTVSSFLRYSLNN